MDVFRFRSIFLSLGTIGALALMIAAFNWTIGPGNPENLPIAYDLDVDMEMEPPPATAEMPEKWTPGRQRGIPVRVMFSLPVRFKLVNS